MPCNTVSDLSKIPGGGEAHTISTLSLFLGLCRKETSLPPNKQSSDLWADPGVLWKKAPRAIRAMRGKTLQTVPFKGISTVLWVHQKLPQSTVSRPFPGNTSYESKTGCNRTPATVLWVPLNLARGPRTLWNRKEENRQNRRNPRNQGNEGQGNFNAFHKLFRLLLGTFKQAVSKQRVTTFAW